MFFCLSPFFLLAIWVLMRFLWTVQRPFVKKGEEFDIIYTLESQVNRNLEAMTGLQHVIQNEDITKSI